MEEKRFSEWIVLKEKLHNLERIPAIREGEVWWCSFGENVGIEINGKSQRFSRPVLILKKLSKLGFIGIPLTSQEKTGSWYIKFDFLNKTDFAAICQARVMSVSKLQTKMGEVPEPDLELVRQGFLKLYSK